ncbi:MAG: hypothetical protein AAF773_00470 [Cyanobacteria bacterium P01_D01_bin.115]
MTTFAYALSFSVSFAAVLFSILFGFLPLMLYLSKLSLEAWTQTTYIILIIALPLLLFLGILQLFGCSETLIFNLSEGLVLMTVKRPIGKSTRTFASRDIRAIILDTLADNGVLASSEERYQVCLTSCFQDNEESRNKGRLMYITDDYEEAQEALEKLNYYLKFV